VSVIAIDGQSAAGKSTAARMVAKDLHGSLIDTGAILRAATARALQEGAAGVGVDSLHALLSDRPPYTQSDADAFYTIEIESAISRMSANTAMQDSLTRRIRAIACQPRLHVVVGRSIGMTVLPAADLKVYLTCSLHSRAIRKAQQLHIDSDDALALLTRRDEADASRKAYAPQRHPESVHIDTTEWSARAVADAIIAAFRALFTDPNA
jgi:CMP/dCMP kinase